MDTSVVERSKALENAQEENRWFCLPCFEGILVIPQSEYWLRPTFGENSVGVIPFLLDRTDLVSEDLDGRGSLIPGSPSDRIFLDEPRLPIDLIDEEVNALTASRKVMGLVAAVAATFYGPETQEKISNEDFALSAIIDDQKGGKWAFAAVADGVSTRTFWAARTSRIACLAAFKAVRQFVLSAAEVDDTALGRLRENLVELLRRQLNIDKQGLLGQRHIIPPHFSPGSYHAFIERNELWYNSTLLVAALGPSHGFIIWAGDGGIELVKTNKGTTPATEKNTDKKVVLSSTEDLSIDTFVSLAVSTKDFSVARITYDQALSKVDLYLSSDGVDRTLQKNADSWSYEKLDLKDHESARTQLQLLSKLEKHDNDNFSIARISRVLDTGVGEVASDLFKESWSRSNDQSETPPQPTRDASISLEPHHSGPKKAESADTGFLQRAAKPSRIRFLAGLVAGLVIGVSIGLVTMRAYDSRFSSPQIGTLHESSGIPPSEGRPKSVVTKPKPLILDASAQNSLLNGKMTEGLSRLLNEWLSYLQQHSTEGFSVVAYADRRNVNDLTDCNTNADVSRRRANAVVSELTRRAQQAGLSLKIKASQRVCEAPAGVSDIKNRESRRVLLVEGMVEDCICDANQ